MGLPAAGVPVAGWLADQARWAALQAQVEPAYDQWRSRHPLAAGMPADALRRSLGVPDPALLGVLAKAAWSSRTAWYAVAGRSGCPPHCPSRSP